MDYFASSDPEDDPTADLRDPFTPPLGLHISPRGALRFEGTGGLYICEGGESNRVFLLTARHVALPPSLRRNDVHAHINQSQPRREVVLLGSRAYQKALESIMVKIGNQARSANSAKDGLKSVGEATEGEDAAREVRGPSKGSGEVDQGSERVPRYDHEVLEASQPAYPGTCRVPSYFCRYGRQTLHGGLGPH